MTVRSGIKVETYCAAGMVRPQFHLLKPATPTAVYEMIPDQSNGFSKTADALYSIYTSFEFRVDLDIIVARRLSFACDTRQKITRFFRKDTDLRVVVRDPNEETKNRLFSTDENQGFLGTGLKYPFTFQRRSGGAEISTATSANHAHIHESIRQILGTKKGERLMRPEFGTRLHELVFEPNDSILYGLIRHEVTETLEEWEPRISVTDVEVCTDDTDGHRVLVNIAYRLISSQVEGNFVYPFWRESE